MSILYSHLVNFGSTSLAYNWPLAGEINNNNNCKAKNTSPCHSQLRMIEEKYLLFHSSSSSLIKIHPVSPVWQLENVQAHCLCVLTGRNINRSGRHVKVHGCACRIYALLDAASLFSSIQNHTRPCSLIPSFSVVLPFGRMLKPPVVTLNANCS